MIHDNSPLTTASGNVLLILCAKYFLAAMFTVLAHVYKCFERDVMLRNTINGVARGLEKKKEACMVLICCTKYFLAAMFIGARNCVRVCVFSSSDGWLRKTKN